MTGVDLIASTTDPGAVITSVVVAATVAAIGQLIRTRQERRKLAADTSHTEAETIVLIQQAAREANADIKSYYESRLRITAAQLADARTEIDRLERSVAERDAQLDAAHREYALLLAEYTDLRARAKHAGIDTT